MLGSQAVPTASCKPWSWEAARSSTQKQWLPGGRPRPGLPWADTSVLNLQEEKKPTSPAEALVSHVPGRCTASLIGISFHSADPLPAPPLRGEVGGTPRVHPQGPASRGLGPSASATPGAQALAPTGGPETQQGGIWGSASCSTSPGRTQGATEGAGAEE